MSMDIPPSTTSGAAGRKHIGQAIFAADGRARAVIFEGRRYDLRPEDGPDAAQKVGAVARQANLYIDPLTCELYDQLGNRLAGTVPRGS